MSSAPTQWSQSLGSWEKSLQGQKSRYGLYPQGCNRALTFQELHPQVPKGEIPTSGPAVLGIWLAGASKPFQTIRQVQLPSSASTIIVPLSRHVEAAHYLPSRLGTFSFPVPVSATEMFLLLLPLLDHIACVTSFGESIRTLPETSTEPIFGFKEALGPLPVHCLRTPI